MDFDIELIPNKSGTLILRQVHSDLWRNVMEEWFPGFFLFCGLLVLLYSWQGLDGYLAVAPFAGVFYVTRTVADACMGIEWAKQHSYFP